VGAIAAWNCASLQTFFVVLTTLGDTEPTAQFS
jgi:hypothetical protein